MAPFMKKPPDLRSKEEKNKELVEMFPFILPKNNMTGRVPDNYDYSYTALDWMPPGWKKKFGLKMCKDIAKSLTRTGNPRKFQIEDIKEKYGALHVYTYGSTLEIENKILPKYERISQRVCGVCGEPATKISIAWIYPLCDKCANSGRPNSYVDIDYFYGEDDGRK